MKATFEKLQAKWRKADEAAREFRFQLKMKYGDAWNTPMGKRNRMEELSARVDRASDDIFAWLDAHSPRSWRTGVPASWVCESLSYEDAVTTGRLSVVPPAAYGSYPSDVLRFAQPVEMIDLDALAAAAE